MWPMYVDYTEDDCKKVLRSLELEAYASIINAFRAQGTLTKERKKMLQELCSVLSISMERHRAEIRRAVNDEHLNTIAERLSGPNTSTEWSIEGRRLVPLMARLVPQTVFTAIADSAAHAQAAKNATLPLPGKTGIKEGFESDSIETMASRKRKEASVDSAASPQKFSALENPCSNPWFSSFDPEPTSIADFPPSSPVSSVTDSAAVPETMTKMSPSFMDYSPVKLASSSVPHYPSPAKTTPKHLMVKPTSTVTTFSSFDPMTSNVSPSKPVPSSVVAHEEQVSTSEGTSTDQQNKLKLSSFPCTVKSASLIHNPVTTCSAPSSPLERLPISSTTTPSNKFLTHIRSKSPRQTLSSNLGLKLNSQPQINQRAVSPKSSGFKGKQDTPTSFFPKKPASTLFTSSSLQDTQVPQLPLTSTTTTTTTANEHSKSVSSPKSQISAAKPSLNWSESQFAANPQSTTKLTPVTKSFQKTPGSQYAARTLFSSSTKSVAKNLPPVIFNVSSTSSTPLQSSAKTTIPVQTETGKVTATQLLPKSTTVGIGHGQFKISGSSAQAFQYRNEGSVRTRIVNISQTPGSRLPCAISPSTISALGLSSNITSTALRVTLPAGTLNTSSAMRVSAAAKPNVIVVHKAQVWPRTQGAAVIMSSSANLPRLSNEVVEAVTLSQKLEKSRLSSTKLLPRTIAPARPQSPAISTSALKGNEVTSTSSSKVTKPEQTVQPDSTNSQIPENPSEAHCKENLLADAIELSGILESSSMLIKSSKNDDPKENRSIDSEMTKVRQKSTSDRMPVISLSDSKMEKVKVMEAKASDVVEEKIPLAVQQQVATREESVTVQKNESCDSSSTSTEASSENTEETKTTDTAEKSDAKVDK